MRLMIQCHVHNVQNMLQNKFHVSSLPRIVAHYNVHSKVQLPTGPSSCIVWLVRLGHMLRALADATLSVVSVAIVNCLSVV